jgi:hypothetical protein
VARRGELLEDPLLVRLVVADHDHPVLLAVAVVAGVGPRRVALGRLGVEELREALGVEAEALRVVAVGGDRLELDGEKLPI